MKPSILIATYGDEKWAQLAQERALPSAEAQGCEVLIGHDSEGTRHETRNGLAEKAMGDYLCFLDADDELLPGYVDAMQRAEERLLDGAFLSDGTWVGEMRPPFLFTPAVSYTYPGHKRYAPAKLHRRTAPDLHDGNHLVVGTLIPVDLFFAIGGWHDWNARTGNEFDDWEIFIRCMKAGAEIVQVPDATYVHMQEPDSLHRQASRATRLHWQYEIGSFHFPEHYPPSWVRGHQSRDRIEQQLQRRRERLGR